MKSNKLFIDLCVLFGFMFMVSTLMVLTSINGKLDDIRTINSETRDTVNCLQTPNEGACQVNP